MKILLVSDTHGKLNEVNRLAAKTKADVCFHLGDLSLYTKESLKTLSADTLLKRLKHLPKVPPAVLSSIGVHTTSEEPRKTIRGMRGFRGILFRQKETGHPGLRHSRKPRGPGSLFHTLQTQKAD